MKIALVFTGISYGHGRDFTHCFPTIKETLIDPLAKEHDASIFVCTYAHEREQELLELYHPVKSLFIPFEGSHQVGTYIKSMEQLKGEDFDFVVATRFDIHFHKNIQELGINYKKFNVLFPEKDWYGKWKWWPIWRKVRVLHYLRLPYFARHTSDNFFAFPYDMLSDFIQALKEEKAHPTRRGLMDMHGVFNKLEKILGKERMNIVSEEEEKSDSNSFYFLCRVR
jgi:hypothetical protein